jgi:ketosteroid isomerase-like protein
VSARLERLREAYAAINRGEFEAVADYLAPDVELRAPANPDRPIRGTAAVIEWLLPDSFDRQHYELRELRESGDRVFAELDFSGRGRGSGIELRQPAWVVYEYDGGLISGISSFPDRASALEAAGLDE